MARAPRTFAGRGHAKAKAGKNAEQNQRDVVTEKLTQALCVGGSVVVRHELWTLLWQSTFVRSLSARRGLFLEAAMTQ